jgi:hypothetical protein
MSLPSFMDMSDARMPRAADLSTTYGPPNYMGMFNSLPRAVSAPYWGPTPEPRDEHLQNLFALTKTPEFELPQYSEWKQTILDQISDYANRLPSRNRMSFAPSVSELYSIRPEYRPPLEGY